jgi:hypothetical protein
MLKEDCICGPINAMCSRVVLTPIRMVPGRSDAPTNKHTLDEWVPLMKGLLHTLRGGSSPAALHALKELWHDLVLTTTMLHDSISAKYDPRQDPARMTGLGSGWPKEGAPTRWKCDRCCNVTWDDRNYCPKCGWKVFHEYKEDGRPEGLTPEQEVTKWRQLCIHLPWEWEECNEPPWDQLERYIKQCKEELEECKRIVRLFMGNHGREGRVVPQSTVVFVMDYHWAELEKLADRFGIPAPENTRPGAPDGPKEDTGSQRPEHKLMLAALEYWRLRSVSQKDMNVSAIHEARQAMDEAAQEVWDHGAVCNECGKFRCSCWVDYAHEVGSGKEPSSEKLDPTVATSIRDEAKEACERGSLLDALTHIAIWEAEHVVRQARQNPTWDSCFGFCFKEVMRLWEKKSEPQRVGNFSNWHPYRDYLKESGRVGPQKPLDKLVQKALNLGRCFLEPSYAEAFQGTKVHKLMVEVCVAAKEYEAERKKQESNPDGWKVQAMATAVSDMAVKVGRLLESAEPLHYNRHEGDHAYVSDELHEKLESLQLAVGEYEASRRGTILNDAWKEDPLIKSGCCACGGRGLCEYCQDKKAEQKKQEEELKHAPPGTAAFELMAKAALRLYQHSMEWEGDGFASTHEWSEFCDAMSTYETSCIAEAHHEEQDPEWVVALAASRCAVGNHEPDVDFLKEVYRTPTYDYHGSFSWWANDEGFIIAKQHVCKYCKTFYITREDGTESITREDWPGKPKEEESNEQ